MEVLVFTIGDPEAGSTKYRIIQYTDFLRANGITLTFVQRKDINRSTVAVAQRADAVLNQKCLVNSSLARNILQASRRVIFDFDDAIYTRPGKPHSLPTRLKVRRRLGLWLGRSHIVVPANGYLERYARRHTDRIRVIPMALDVELWKPVKRAPGETVTVGWTGSPVNVRYLEALDPVLEELRTRNPDLRVMVYSGQRPNLSFPFEYHPFVPGTEPGFVQQLDIGLLPLKDEEFLRGKSPIKAIQYLACGVPVVGNVFGATGEILKSEWSLAVSSRREWFSAINELIKNRQKAKSMGISGRRFIEKAHNMDHCGKILLEVIRGKSGN